MSQKQNHKDQSDAQKDLLRRSAAELYLLLREKNPSSLSVEERYFLENYKLYLKDTEQLSNYL